MGLGYIGLPTAAMFASRQVEVIGVDVNQQVVDSVNRGEIHIAEPELDVAVSDAVKRGYLRATTVPEPADAFLIAVPTPFEGEDHQPDLGFVEAAARAISPVLQRGNLVVLESTSPIGATEAMADWLALSRPDLTFPQTAGKSSDVRIAHCPERVLPGKVMQELVTNDRVIGGMSSLCSALAAEMYQIFVKGECVIASTPRLAEMAKLTENSFRDVNIAFANELSLICNNLEVDVWELLALANRHPRVSILQPGPGVGGHCIAVDPWFIVNAAPDQAVLIRTAREVNDRKVEWILEKIFLDIQLLAKTKNVSESKIPVVLYGLTYKADVNDLRESPALKILEGLGRHHAGEIYVVEPHIKKVPGNATAKLVTYQASLRLDGVFVMLVDHSQFREFEPPSTPFLIDTRGFWRST